MFKDIPCEKQLALLKLKIVNVCKKKSTISHSSTPEPNLHVDIIKCCSVLTCRQSNSLHLHCMFCQTACYTPDDRWRCLLLIYCYEGKENPHIKAWQKSKSLHHHLEVYICITSSKGVNCKRIVSL